MNRQIYLDYNASTPLAPEVAEAMRPFLSVPTEIPPVCTGREVLLAMLLRKPALKSRPCSVATQPKSSSLPEEQKRTITRSKGRSSRRRIEGSISHHNQLYRTSGCAGALSISAGTRRRDYSSAG